MTPPNQTEKRHATMIRRVDDVMGGVIDSDVGGEGSFHTPAAATRCAVAVLEGFIPSPFPAACKPPWTVLGIDAREPPGDRAGRPNLEKEGWLITI